ncbi:collagen-like protein [Bradyrhizobium sp. KB893862 SZCCT0404]|uniref:collagen-like protein n=1 Tax=Bradyrhizobium sp. KB893862 SZCCT0404 TaxID=2807672 RepID=UPI001BA60F13|nr:collagen-like protein [Bradyrhizobium sp. KB893862 SZCCT0404]MBR1174870.1 collagen-like protein [Bradyrhizobium sp. KB893862 SZCCT0404]
MTIAQRDVVPSESHQGYLLEVWKECLVEMLADVADVKARHEDAFETVRANASAAVAEARASYGDALTKLERAIDERLGRLRKLIEEKNGPRIKPYEENAIHYEGQLVVHQGATFQALRDTAKPPCEESDWICVAAGGLDGRSPRVRGTYAAGERYSQLDIVALNGAAFIACRSNPGPCPGDGWQLISSQGKRGPQGPRGERGERGPSGAKIASWRVEPADYTATPVMNDGTEGPPLELRRLFDQFHQDAI